jgi:hypothetical protein
MLHAGLDLSRGKLDVCLLSDQGEHLDQLVAPPDADGPRRLARRIEEVHAEPVRAAIESMTGALRPRHARAGRLGGRDRRRRARQGGGSAPRPGRPAAGSSLGIAADDGEAEIVMVERRIEPPTAGLVISRQSGACRVCCRRGLGVVAVVWRSSAFSTRARTAPASTCGRGRRQLRRTRRC